MDPSPCFEAWLMGCKGENMDVLEDLVRDAVRDLAHWRKHIHPLDAEHITEAIKDSAEYRQSVADLRTGYRRLLDFLKRSVPAFSMRYQAHMGWDLAVPSVAGYFAAMLHGPNNAAFEGSPATSVLEQVAVEDICRMFRFAVDPANGAEGPRAWGHLTGGGTISNIEALWSALNLKLHPLALHRALLAERPILDADATKALLRELKVAYKGRSTGFLELDDWALLNLAPDEALALPDRIVEISGKAGSASFSKGELEARAFDGTVRHLGLAGFYARHRPAGPDGAPIGFPAFVVSGTRHYSFEKAAGVLGIGLENLLSVDVDEDARMHLGSLDSVLEACADARRPVLAAVAVVGTTEEGAVDPVLGILGARERFRKERGLDFVIHADAAWGGYHASIVREDYPLFASGKAPREAAAPSRGDRLDWISLSRYVREQFQALNRVDSVSIDPHKQGHMVYPGGCLCYRNGAMRSFLKYSGPYIAELDDSIQHPFMGVFGLEGSRPGAAAASVFLTHSLIRPSRSGYGRLLGMELFNGKQFYAMLHALGGAPRGGASGRPVNIKVTPTAPPGIPPEDMERVVTTFLRTPNAGLGDDADSIRRILEEMGPDLNILAYGFNFISGEEWNPHLELANLLNQRIFRRFCPDPSKARQDNALFLSKTDIEGFRYGPVFMRGFCARAGLSRMGGQLIGEKEWRKATVTVLRSVVCDPWLSDTVDGTFFDDLSGILAEAVADEIRTLERELDVLLGGRKLSSLGGDELARALPGLRAASPPPDYGRSRKDLAALF